MPEKKAVPPLWCLPVALILTSISCLIIGCDYFTLEVEPKQRDLSEAYCQYFKNIDRERKPNERIVVALGASYLRYAVLDPDEFVMLSKECGLNKLILVRALYSVAVNHLDRNFIKSLTELRPNVVIIQYNSLFYDKPRGDFRSHLLYKLKKIYTGGRNRYIKSDDPLRFRLYSSRITKPREVGELKINSVRKRRLESFTGRLRDDVLAVISSCRQIGSRVLIVKVPITEQWGHSESDFTETKELLLAQLVDSHKVKILKCPLHFSEPEFIDLRHMTLAGAGKYTRWLIEQLKVELNELD